MSQNRIIGRVLSVDYFRVFIKIEDDIKGAFSKESLEHDVKPFLIEH